jgi:hypothetical protein
LAASSLSWRFQHDTAIMLYIAYCIDHFGSIPYVDLFDMNMPGAYWAYVLIGRITDYQDVASRYCDLTLLAFLMIMAYLWQREIGKKVALTGAILFGISYLSFGPAMSLQREFIALLPIAASLYLLSLERLGSQLRYFLVGFLFGMAAIVKPHTAIGLAPIVFVESLFTESREDLIGVVRRFCAVLFPVFVGVIIPALLVIVYLASRNSLAAFLDIAVHYWPLYTFVGGSRSASFDGDHFRYLFHNYKLLGGHGLWLCCAILGIYISLNETNNTERQTRHIMLLGLLTFVYSIYPFLSGQFWDHHWLPFLFFAIQLSCLCLRLDSSLSVKRILIPFGLFLAVSIYTLIPSFWKTSMYFSGNRLPEPRNGRVDEIASFLRKNLRESDVVQPLDWGGGAVHAMLISKAKPATQFIYDFHFYHHVSNSYMQGLRKRFIAELEAVKPRFMIDVSDYYKRPLANESEAPYFSELFRILNHSYQPALRGSGYVIYERDP